MYYEGYYFNGERNGIGKVYYNNGNLNFEGEYLVGRKYNGKIYNILGEMKCEIKQGQGHIKSFTYPTTAKNSFPFPFFSPFKYSPSNSNSSLSLYSFILPFPFSIL